MLPAEYPRHLPEPSTSFPCRAWSCRRRGPFFGRGEGAVHEAFVPADLLAVIQLGQEGAPEFQQDTVLLPLPEPPPAGGGASVPPGKLAPGGSGPKNPEDPLEAPAVIQPGAAAFGVGLPGREMGPDQPPLPIGDTSPRHGGTPLGGEARSLAYGVMK